MAQESKKRRRIFQYLEREQPFDQILLLPVRLELERKAILKQCILARAYLAELKQAAELISNQGTPINTLPLLEPGQFGDRKHRNKCRQAFSISSGR